MPKPTGIPIFNIFLRLAANGAGKELSRRSVLPAKCGLNHPAAAQRAGNDIFILAEHFIKKFSRKFSKKVKGLTRAAKCAIASYPWPGNARELQNVIERAVIMTFGSVIDVYPTRWHDLVETAI